MIGRRDPVASLRVEVGLNAASLLALTGSAGQRSALVEFKAVQPRHELSRRASEALSESDSEPV